MKHGSLFSGIGGFDLAAQWMGWDNVFHCEKDSFCRHILNYYWPNAISYEDITTTDFSIHRGKIDIITGGFPCQPFSNSGLKKGDSDSRYLWPSMLGVIRDVAPKWVIGENVTGLITQKRGGAFEKVCADLENEGYQVQPFVLPAVAYGANHIRERVWFIANSVCLGRENVSNDIRSSTKKARNSERGRQEKEWRQQKTNDLDSPCNNFLQYEKECSESPIFNVANGIPFELDGITIPKWTEESLKSAGNAVYPPLVYAIFKSIQQYELSYL